MFQYHIVTVPATIYIIHDLILLPYSYIIIIIKCLQVPSAGGEAGGVGYHSCETTTDDQRYGCATGTPKSTGYQQNEQQGGG